MTQQELQQIANGTIDFLNRVHGSHYNPCEIQIRNVNRGRYRLKTHRITIPLWAVTYENDMYQTYYVIHEVVHIAAGRYHSDFFKQVEILALKKYGMVPFYKKAYPHRLVSLAGTTLWEQRYQ